jgi:hypothetical protein
MRRGLAIGAAWLIVLAVGVGQWVAGDVGAGHHPDLLAALGDLGPVTACWAAATPAILWTARRWPVGRGDAARHVVVHTGFAISFVVALNAAVRIPVMIHQGAATFTADLGLGLARFGPVALLVYGTLVGIGHLVRPGRDRLAGRSPAAGLLVAQEGHGAMVVAPEEIEWIEARGNYVRIHTTRGTRLVRHRISALEAQLDPVRFVRTHRSAIVALRAVREVRPRRHGDRTVVLRDGSEVPLTRARRAALDAALNVR